LKVRSAPASHIGSRSHARIGRNDIIANVRSSLVGFICFTAVLNVRNQSIIQSINQSINQSVN